MGLAKTVPFLLLALLLDHSHSKAIGLDAFHNQFSYKYQIEEKIGTDKGEKDGEKEGENGAVRKD